MVTCHRCRPSDIRSIPCAPTQTRASRHHVTLRPTRSCLFGQNGQPKWRPGFFFSFFKDVVEIPRRVRLSLRRLWLRPTYKEIPATLTSRAFSRPKWRGCSPFLLRQTTIHPDTLTDPEHFLPSFERRTPQWVQIISLLGYKVMLQPSSLPAMATGSQSATQEEGSWNCTKPLA